VTTLREWGVLVLKMDAPQEKGKKKDVPKEKEKCRLILRGKQTSRSQWVCLGVVKIQRVPTRFITTWFVFAQCSTYHSPHKPIVLTFDCIFFATNMWRKKQIHFTAAMAAWVAVDGEGPEGSRWHRSGGPDRGPPAAPCDRRHPPARESYCTVSRDSSG